MKERPILFSAPMVKAILAGTKTQTRRVVKVDAKSVLGKARLEAGWECSPENAVVGDLSWVAAIGGNAKGVKDLQRYQQLNVPVRHPEDRETPWDDCGRERIYCPYGSPGNVEYEGARLWVRETWGTNTRWDDVKSSELPDPAGIGARIYYRADYPASVNPERLNRWRPSIFMPRWASRIALEIVSVRVERLCDISEEDAIAEGVKRRHDVFHPSIQSSIENVAIRNFAVLWESINGPGSWELNPWVWAITFRRTPVQPVAAPGEGTPQP